MPQDQNKPTRWAYQNLTVDFLPSSVVHFTLELITNKAAKDILLLFPTSPQAKRVYYSIELDVDELFMASGLNSLGSVELRIAF